MTWPHTILVVDDEQDVIRSLQHLLRLEHRVVGATRAQEGLRIMASEEVHIVVADQRMPEMSGVEFLHRIREQYPKAVRLLITGYADIRAVIDAINHGNVFGYIAKPWDPDQLQAKLREVVAHYDLLAERQRLLEELQQAIKTRDEFLSIAAHELRTPLTPLMLRIQWLLQFVRRELGGATAGRLSSGLETAERQVERLTRLVNELLDITRIREGRLELRLEDVDLAAVVREVAERFCPDPTQAVPPLIVRADTPVVGRLDRMRIDQVVTNILSNAVKFGAGQPIEIGVEQTGDTACLTIRDHGIGIALDDQVRIFERFERAVSKKHYGGFGLGLWIVRQIVTGMGGEVSVKSQPGAGATFRVVLPLTSPQPASAGHPHSSV